MTNDNPIIEPRTRHRNWRLVAVVCTVLSLLGLLVAFGLIWWLDDNQPPQIRWDADKLGGS